MSSCSFIYDHNKIILLRMSTGITTLCVAGILLRSYYNKRWSKTRTTKGYEPVNGEVKDHESINGSIDSINFALLRDKDNCKDYQTIKQSLL